MINEIINLSAGCGGARDQGDRATCLAFASSDFNRYTNALSSSLSVEYLAHHAVKLMKNWKAGDGLSMSAAIGALKTPGQPIENEYPYDSADKGKPLATVPAQVGQLYVSDAKRRKLVPSDIEADIKQGRVVCLALTLSDSFYTPLNGIIKYETGYDPNARHAVLGVGLGEHATTKEMHVLIRNSWGTAWGQAGHAWLPAQYLNTHLLDSFAL